MTRQQIEKRYQEYIDIIESLVKLNKVEIFSECYHKWVWRSRRDGSYQYCLHCGSTKDEDGLVIRTRIGRHTFYNRVDE